MDFLTLTIIVADDTIVKFVVSAALVVTPIAAVVAVCRITHISIALRDTYTTVP